MLSASDWAIQQWQTVDLGDVRLNRRAVAVGREMAARPPASLPQQMGAPKALRGAYALFNHPGVQMEQLLAPHKEQTLAAAGRERGVVLLVEDTSELDFTNREMRGLGPIGDAKGRGLLLHSTLAVQPVGRQVLGLAHAEVVLRIPKAERPRQKWFRSPEGMVWHVSVQQTGGPPAGKRWVHVSDSGSDNFDYLQECRTYGKHFLIRAFRNRRLDWSALNEQVVDPEAGLLIDFAHQLTPHPDSKYTIQVPLSAKPATLRQADVVIQWAEVRMAPPVQAPDNIRARGSLTAWLVRVWEPNPPADVKPVEWILLSSLPVNSLSDAQERVAWYTCRWLCEDFHQCLKTGCQIERRQFDDARDIQVLLGFAMPIAVRLLQMRQAVRQLPDVLASTLVDPLMVQLLAHRVGVDWQTMRAQDFWRLVARMGGHLGRKSDGPPGWRTLWRGWQDLAIMTEGAHLFADLGNQ